MVGVKAANPTNTRRRTLMSLETPTFEKKTRRSTLIKRIEQPKTPLVLSQETPVVHTPKETTKAVTNCETPKTALVDPVFEKIRRDLNSPSAAARIRAQRALKSPGFCKATYQIFDVCHEEQDIITAEERQPYKPKTIREIFANCCIYVEVRSEDDNRSAGIKNKLTSDGIRVSDKLSKDTTHVIFKDGFLRTFKQARKYGIPLTTVLWIESCKSQKRLVDPSKFPISNLERYENPELYGRFRFKKSMQPVIAKMVSVRANTDDLQDETFGEDVTITNDKTVKDCAEMEMTVDNSNKTTTDSTIELATQQNIQFTAKKSATSRRITTFTPRPMEQTNLEPSQAWKSVDRRQTIYESQFSDEITPKGQADPSRRTLMFNSQNRVASQSRRSILDISMNIFDLNCKAMSEKKKLEEEKEDDGLDSLKNITITQAVKPPAVRKRKLFSNFDLDDSTEYKENCKTPETSKKLKCDMTMSTKSIGEKKKSKLSGVDRRKTISFFKAMDNKTEDSKANIKITPIKPSTKYIVCTNMPSADREIAQTAVQKLGGVIEKEVSEKTTHIITPNTERTMNLLRGVVRACYILKTDWVTDSLKAGMFLDTTLYQHEICNNQKIFERKILGKNFKNLTFSHYGPFFVSKDTIDNAKKVEYVKEIIELCSGHTTSNIHEARIIVSDRPVVVAGAYKKPIVVISTYIFDSAMQGKMIPNAKYAPKVS